MPSVSISRYVNIACRLVAKHGLCYEWLLLGHMGHIFIVNLSEQKSAIRPYHQPSSFQSHQHNLFLQATL
jgi:hypothetical protein